MDSHYLREQKKKCLIDKILHPKNLTKAYTKVWANRGSAGVDGMGVKDLKKHIDTYRGDIVREIINDRYIPSAIKGVEIPKSNDERKIPKGECLGDIQEREPQSGRAWRLLGIPTVVDRWLQQAVSQQLMTRFERNFSNYSYGFRPQKNLQQAVQQSLAYINDGYQDIVDIDLQKFFDEVIHCRLLQLLYDKVRCHTTMRLIRKWLRAPILIEGKLQRRRKGVPQDERMNPFMGKCPNDI